MKRRTLVTGAVLLALAACSAPLEFPDWTLPVADDTPVLGYAHVPLEERHTSIEWVEELVIGDRGDTDMRYAFGRPSDVTVDARGQIYVVDGQAAGVKVFDAAGEYLRELGGEGQGPGEFQSPWAVASLGDVVIVGAARNARWSHFDLDGNHIDDYPYPIYDNLRPVVATDAGELVGSTIGAREDGDVVLDVYAYGIYSPQAEKLRSLVEMTHPVTPMVQRGNRMWNFSNMPWAYPQAAVAPDGGVYWTRSDEYQILALDANGAQRWALRVAVTPPPLTREEIDGVMATVHRALEDATESEVNFPERQPAVGRILVDGHGHLYVFPYSYAGLTSATSADPASVPVDVYAADGERLFSGMSPARSWVHADGDHVWEIGRDPETEEYVVRKVRLGEPFE